LNINCIFPHIQAVNFTKTPNQPLDKIQKTTTTYCNFFIFKKHLRPKINHFQTTNLTYTQQKSVGTLLAAFRSQDTEGVPVIAKMSFSFAQIKAYFTTISSITRESPKHISTHRLLPFVGRACVFGLCKPFSGRDHVIIDSFFQAGFVDF
jgi:hypothetical protein